MAVYQFRFRRKVPSWCCPFCGRPVGYLGQFFAWLFGTGMHGCAFGNVKGPHDA